MVDRIIFDKDGVRVSKPNFDANTASRDNMAMYVDMNPCLPLLSNSAVFTGVGTRTFSFTTPNLNIVPTVILRSSQGDLPSSSTYRATLNHPYNSLVIRNIDGISRTVEFKVLF